MFSVMFICHGNICRSTMAEFLFKDMVEKMGIGDLFVIASSGTSREEIGNPVHPGTVKKLKSVGVQVVKRGAIQLKASDLTTYDYLLCMDSQNMKNAARILGEGSQMKLKRLLDYTSNPRDIADPWYTGNYDQTYQDIHEGLQALLKHMGYLNETL